VVTAPSAVDAPSDRRARPSSPGDEPPAGVLAAEHLAELMTGCASGDQQCFAELYDRTVRRVYGTVLRVLRSPEYAEEVTQEVYVEVWRQAPRYAAEKGSVMAWISTMAHRRAVDRVRSRTSEVARDERYAYANAEREGDDVWDSVAQNQDVERVRKAIATLSPIQQQAVRLAYLQGLTQSEISSLLNVPIGTVKTRIRDGFRRLGDALRSEER
jgi:RNA polymerase sigma-70 factor (ECF subfamily)